MRILLTASMLAATLAGANAAQPYVPPQQTQSAQPQQSTQDQLVGVYAALNLNLAKQLDAASARAVDLQAQVSDLQKKLEEATKPEKK